MGALSIAISNNDFGDLYIVPQFSGASECASRLQELKIFNRVKVVNLEDIEKHKRYSNKFMKYIGILKCYIKVDSIARTYLFNDVIYRRIYISSQAYVGRMACLYYIWNDLTPQIVLFDDGEGSYDNNHIIQQKLFDKIAQYMIGGDCLANHIIKLMLFNPSIYKNVNLYDAPYNIEQIGFKKFETYICNNLRQIFNVEEKHIIKEQVIIIDTVIEEAIYTKDIKHLQDIYKLVYKICGNDKVLIKPHPRNKNRSTSDNFYAYNMPIEELCLIQNFTHSIFITLSSTAVAIPKLIFNQEPYIILLYNLIRLKTVNHTKQDKYYEAINSQYSHNKIYIPNSFIELEVILKNLMFSL